MNIPKNARLVQIQVRIFRRDLCSYFPTARTHGETSGMPAIGRPFQFGTDLVSRRLDEVLFDRMWSFVPQLRGYLRHRLSPVEAEDVIQDVFLRLFQCASCRTVTFPKSYLFETAHAVLIDRRRRAASRCASMHSELTDSHHPTNELSPLRILLGREQLKAVECAIECLPTRTREIIIAIRIEGASLKSLAARYQISTSAVEKHVGRALRALSLEMC